MDISWNWMLQVDKSGLIVCMFIEWMNLRHLANKRQFFFLNEMIQTLIHLLSDGNDTGQFIIKFICIYSSTQSMWILFTVCWSWLHCTVLFEGISQRHNVYNLNKQLMMILVMVIIHLILFLLMSPPYHIVLYLHSICMIK